MSQGPPSDTARGSGSERLAERLAALSPYAAIDDPRVARRLGQPLHDPAELVDHVAGQLGTRDRMVAASVGFQTVTSRAAVSLGLANEVVSTSVAPSFDALRWRVVDGEVRIGFVELHDGAGVSWPRFVSRFVAELVEPWVGAMRRHTRIGRRLLWGNAAASLLAAVDSIAASGPHADGDVHTLAEEALADPRVAGLAVVTGNACSIGYRRRTCCLIFKAPGYGRCGECSLRGPARG